MAVQLHITGPVTIKRATTSVGQTDGEVLIDIVHRRAVAPVTLDSTGGEVATYIQLQDSAFVTIRFQQFDREQLYQLERKITAVNAIATMATGIYATGAVGKDLAVADPGDLVLEGTDNKITFYEAFPDPDGEWGIRGVGHRPHFMVASFHCLANASGQIYRYEAVT